MPKTKKSVWVVVVIATVITTVLLTSCRSNRQSGRNGANLESYAFPSSVFDGVSFQTEQEKYDSDFNEITALLTNTKSDSEYAVVQQFTLVKEVSGKWYIVPFAAGVAFDEIAYILEPGGSQSYTLDLSMLDVDLNEGTYRIVTTIWENDAESVEHTVWAEFGIE